MSPGRRRGPLLRAVSLGRAGRLLGALVIIVAMVAAAVTVVRLAYGAFSNQYALTATFPQAGEGLAPGSEVQHDGVTVGQVGGIKLVHRQAQVQLKIDSGFHVPSNVKAVISSENVFGVEIVDLQFPDGDRAPALQAGAAIGNTSFSPEITGLLAAADPLLNQINGRDLATVIGELSEASQGEGPQIARSFQEGAKLADLLSNTVNAQITALQSFDRFTGALAPAANSINAISANENVALPTFNAEAAAYQNVLTAFVPVANELANYLSAYRPEIAQLLVQGDNPVRVLIADKAYISQTIDGLYHYTQKFATGLSPETLPNGTHFAYFKVFVLFQDVNNLVCGLLAPNQPGLSYLKPLQQVLIGAGSPFNCSAQLAAFNAAQGPGVPAAAAPSAPSAPQAAQNLSNQLGGIIGTPQPGTSHAGNLGTVLNGVLGGGQ